MFERTWRRSRRCVVGPTSQASPSPTPRCTVSAAPRSCGRSRPPACPRRSPSPPQFEPDGTFPTVSFPNPEEPGAMDLLIETAREAGADLAIANDPDADRLAAAIPQPDGSWRRLGGDEIGWLFADYLLVHSEGDDRLVVTTLVSSALLGEDRRRARRPLGRDVHRVQVDRPGGARPTRSCDFVMGYEQALGYLVAQQPLDKDGISAAVLFAEMAAGGRGRRPHDAGVARRHRRPFRPTRARRRVGADGPRGRSREGRRAAERPPGVDRRSRRAARPRSTPGPTCSDSSSTVVSGSRSGRVAPSRR